MSQPPLESAASGLIGSAGTLASGGVIGSAGTVASAAVIGSGAQRRRRL